MKRTGHTSGVVLGLSAVLVAVEDNAPKAFIVRGAEHALSVGVDPVKEDGDALPFGPFDPSEHTTLEQGLRSWVKTQTPLTPGYVEQLYTFGNRGRYAGQDGPARVVSVGYLALTSPDDVSADEKIFWGDWYAYFPWEDWRDGRPRVIDDVIALGLKRWVSAATTKADKAYRRARADVCFGLHDSPWDAEKVLERYELLYEARLVFEAIRDRDLKVDYVLVPGRSMLYDHRRILATAMGRLRGKLKYRPVVFELLPEEFTLLQLQKTVEAIMGHLIHKQNFRRLVESAGMVEEVAGKKSLAAGGRPAALFRFRRDVVLERPAPGVKVSAAGK
ncbi:MAG: hypothetical protein OXT65_10630 [Alphaproteobacteria bacterium]|nr:hypothetical protein [Alphaproteobacteria bacterium]